MRKRVQMAKTGESFWSAAPMPQSWIWILKLQSICVRKTHAQLMYTIRKPIHLIGILFSRILHNSFPSWSVVCIRIVFGHRWIYICWKVNERKTYAIQLSECFFFFFFSLFIHIFVSHKLHTNTRAWLMEWKCVRAKNTKRCQQIVKMTVTDDRRYNYLYNTQASIETV